MPKLGGKSGTDDGGAKIRVTMSLEKVLNCLPKKSLYNHLWFCRTTVRWAKRSTPLNVATLQVVLLLASLVFACKKTLSSLMSTSQGTHL